MTAFTRKSLLTGFVFALSMTLLAGCSGGKNESTDDPNTKEPPVVEKDNSTTEVPDVEVEFSEDQ